MDILTERNYKGLRKCVLSDYPYELEWDDKLAMPLFCDVHDSIVEQHSHIDTRYYSTNGKGILALNFLDHYVILAHRFANALWKADLIEYANAVYYSLRVRGSIDLYFTTELGSYFMPTHSLGTCMDAHAKYGKLFKIYNNCHIGPYNIVGLQPSEWMHPVFGDYVTLLAGTKVYGNTVIGNNVIASVNTVIINEEIPDNCIVSGVSPNLVFQRLKAKNSSLLVNL